MWWKTPISQPGRQRQESHRKSEIRQVFTEFLASQGLHSETLSQIIWKIRTDCNNHDPLFFHRVYNYYLCICNSPLDTYWSNYSPTVARFGVFICFRSCFVFLNLIRRATLVSYILIFSRLLVFLYSHYPLASFPHSKIDSILPLCFFFKLSNIAG